MNWRREESQDVCRIDGKVSTVWQDHRGEVLRIIYLYTMSVLRFTSRLQEGAELAHITYNSVALVD
jgi:hypothetical protein